MLAFAEIVFIYFVLGVFTLIMTFPGCFGTFKKSHTLLYIYGGFLGMIFVIFLGCSITLFNMKVSINNKHIKVYMNIN